MQPTDHPPITRLFVPGRGIEQDGSLKYDSPTSGDSFDRAVAAAEYAAEHPEVTEVRWSGAYTFILDATGQVPRGREAEAMEEIAMFHGLPQRVKSITEAGSKTTYANYVAAASVYKAGETVGLVIHDDHLERAQQVGRLVLPGVTFVQVRADNPNRAAANDTARNRDGVAGLLYGAAMLGVRPGNLASIHRRDNGVQNLVTSGLRLVHKLRG